MLKSIAFATRARTVDHLGREQIADCPTAVSELWKNAFDAYARKVELNIFDGEFPVAAMVDNGHGMSYQEFIDKWLVIGTESKRIDNETSIKDRDGLPIRPKQGQKGIGRLSCAALGSLLLLISKRLNENYVAALIDWRLFENPYLMLSDISIPVVEFNSKNDLYDHLPNMFDELMGNIWGSSKKSERDERVVIAWKNFEEIEKKENKEVTTKTLIEETVIGTCFTERHFSTWPVWNENSDKGTALFMSGINDDLVSQLEYMPNSDETLVKTARENFIQTLSNFTDPYTKEEEEIFIKDFSCSVIAWEGQLRRAVIDEEREFDISNLEGLETSI